MKKFSELSNSSLLFVNDELVCKKNVLDNLSDYRNGDFFVANEDKIEVNTELVQNMLEDFSESLCDDRELYEDWDDEFMKQITNEDLEQITKVIKGIIKRVPTCCEAGEEIEFDM